MSVDGSRPTSVAARSCPSASTTTSASSRCTACDAVTTWSSDHTIPVEGRRRAFTVTTAPPDAAIAAARPSETSRRVAMSYLR